MNQRGVFVAALLMQDDQERAAYLDDVCGRNTEVRNQIESLLTERYQLGDFLETPASGLIELDTHDLDDQHCRHAGESPSAVESVQYRTLGDFRLLREIGCGGMGVVYEAEQISLGRRVALKVLPFASMLDRRHRERFTREARAAGSLKHPNIVHVYSVGCEGDVHYFAMEFVSGITLAQMIQEWQANSGTSRHGLGGDGGVVGAPVSGQQSAADRHCARSSALPAEDPHAQSVATNAAENAEMFTAALHSLRDRAFFHSVAHLGIQAAEALEHAHQMGVIHRDINPSNLMITQDGHLWILDFGLALLRNDMRATVTGDIMGTLRYMSPEQAAGKSASLDHRTDIYSLGATLYEVLTRRPCFDGHSWQELLQKITDEQPQPPRKVNSAMPRDLETIVLKAIAKLPAHRYQTARELADDLRRYVANKPIRAKGYSLWHQPFRRLCTNRWLTMTSLSVVVLLLTTPAVWLLKDRPVAPSPHSAATSRSTVLLRRPTGMRFGPDGNGDGVPELFVASANSDEVLRYDGHTGTLLGVFVSRGSGGLNFPNDMVFGPDGHLYVGSRESDEIIRYDGTTGKFRDVFVTARSGGLYKSSNFRFGRDKNGDGHQDLYVASGYSDTVLVYDGMTGAFLETFVSEGSGGLDYPIGLSFGPDGNGDSIEDLYVSSYFQGKVLRYDGCTGKYIDAFVPKGNERVPRPGCLAFGPDGTLYVCCGETVLRFSGVTGEFVDKFATPRDLGDFGWNFVFGPDGDLFMASTENDEVLRFRRGSGEFIGVFSSNTKREVNVHNGRK